MKILWIPHDEGTGPQRGPRIFEELAQRHEVHTVRWRSLRFFQGNAAAVSTTDRGVILHDFPLRIPGGTTLSFLTSLNTRLYSQLLERLVRRERFDVVVGSPVAHPPQGVPLVYDMCDDHASYWEHHRSKRHIAATIRHLEAEWVRRSAHIVVIGATLRSTVRERYAFLSPEHVSIVPNPVAIRRFRNLPTEQDARSAFDLPSHIPIITIMASFSEFSGLKMLLNAFHRMQHRESLLVIAGEGKTLAAARAHAKRLGLGSSVRFLGWVLPDRIPFLLAATTVGVVPHHRSPFTEAACPLKLLEYLAAGCRVVATNLTEVRTLTLPNTLLVEDTAEAVAKGLERAVTLGRPPLVPEDALRPFDTPNVVSQYEHILKNASS